VSCSYFGERIADIQRLGPSALVFYDATVLAVFVAVELDWFEVLGYGLD
jgi:hypothetical protein